MNSYNEMTRLLDHLGFADFYQSQLRELNCHIDFGKKKGQKHFTSIRSAAEQYIYDTSGKYAVAIDQQLTRPSSMSESELILACVEVFDWGGVQASNIIDALNLHRNQQLQPLLATCHQWFENDQSLAVDIEDIRWSSGWTKVFSFMFDLTTIYDSRVAAYINYMLAKFFASLQTDEQKTQLKLITQYLVSFNGTATRARCLNKEFRSLMGIVMKTANAERNFKANKVASWFLRYVCSLEYEEVTQHNFRQVDKAMFMLGFDLNQVDGAAPFN